MDSNSRVQEIVASLEMQSHPEGGFYKETYRSSGVIPKEVLGDNFSGDRNYATAIYFLITANNFSAFHRIQQDEIWHFYEGDPLSVHIIIDGKYKKFDVGVDFGKGQLPQLVVPAGCWFASSVQQGGDYSLVGCTVAPGFDFEDFELGGKESLSRMFPDCQSVINKYTRF